jgi:hypothetical protein
MARSAPAQNAGLAEVMTARGWRSVLTRSTSASSSRSPPSSMTFIDRPGMSQVTTSTPSGVVSVRKLSPMTHLSVGSPDLRVAVAAFVAHEGQVDVGIVHSARASLRVPISSSTASRVERLTRWWPLATPALKVAASPGRAGSRRRPRPARARLRGRTRTRLRARASGGGRTPRRASGGCRLTPNWVRPPASPRACARGPSPCPQRLGIAGAGAQCDGGEISIFRHVIPSR